MLDIFNNDAFSMTSMTQALDLVEHVPSQFSSSGLFTPNPVRTESVAIEMRKGKIGLIQTSERGAPLDKKTGEKRTIRDLRTVRIARSATIHAHELQFLRAMGQESAVVAAQQEIARRLSGPNGLMADLDMTKEHMYLGAAQGILLDADATPIYNFYDEFDVTATSELAFDLATKADGALREFIQKNIIRPLRRAAKGLAITGVDVYCGDQFWDDLMKNTEFRETWLAQQAGAELRKNYDGDKVEFAGCTFQQYTGTDDNSKVAVADTKCIIIPRANGLFETAYSPAESFAEVGQLGKPEYAMVIPDKDRDAFVDIEVYSYLLPYCSRPELLMKGRTGA